MAMDLNLLVYTNREKMLSALIEKSEDFFGESIDKSKSSFLRYQHELMADLLADINLFNGIMFNERYINTARFKKNLLGLALPFGYVEKNSEPERIESTVGIKITDADYTNVGYVHELRQSDIIFKEGRIDYILPGDVRFVVNENNIWSVLINDKLNTLEDNYTQVISQLINIDGERYLIFKCDLYQLKLNTSSEIILTREDLTYYTFNINTTGDLHTTNIFFRDGNGVKQYLRRISSFVDIEPNKSLNVYTMEALDDNRYEVTLDNGSRFNFLQTGLELQIETYETMGLSGRVKEPIFTVINNSNNNRSLIATSQLESHGGRDKLGLQELKRDIIKTIQTPDRKTIVNRQDFTNVMSDLLDIPVDELVLLLRRNDPLLRQTDLFIKVKDYKNELLQTNTLNLKTDGSSANFGSFTKFKLDGGYLTEVLPGENDPGYKYYYNILPMRVNDTPYYHLDVFCNSVRETVKLVERYNSINHTKYSIASEFLDFKYDSMQKKYFFSVNLFANDSAILDNETFMNNLNVEIYFTLDGFGNFKLKLERNPDISNIFDGSFTTDEIYNENNNLLIGGVDVDTGTGFTPVAENVNTVNMSNLCDLDIYIYTNDTTQKNMSNSDINEQEVVSFRNRFHKNDNNFTLFSRRYFKNIKFFDIISDLLSSSIEEVDSSSDIIINNLPVIGAPDYEVGLNNKVIESLTQNILSVSERVSDIKEEPSKLGIKFFNTYGETEDYSGLTGTDIRLEVEISINTKIASADVINEVKREISKVIEDRTKFSVETTTEDRNIYLSDIITTVKENVVGVVQIRILKINGSDNGNINFKYEGNTDYTKLDKSIIKNYTPSIPNSRTDYISVVIT